MDSSQSLKTQFSQKIATLLAASNGFLSPRQACTRVCVSQHLFYPNKLEVPAGQKIKLVVRNLDSDAKNINIHWLKCHRCLNGNSETTVTLGPLKAGVYPFFCDDSKKLALCQIVAK